MSLFSDLLKSAADNPRPLIVSLVGLIAIGGITGSLYIRSLQSSLDEADRLTEKRLELIEERYKTGLGALQSRNAILESQLLQLKNLAARVAALPTEHDSLADDELVSSLAQDAREALDQSDQLAQLASELASAQLAPAVPVMTSPILEQPSLVSRFITFFPYALLSLLSVGLLWYSIKRVRRGN